MPENHGFLVLTLPRIPNTKAAVLLVRPCGGVGPAGCGADIATHTWCRSGGTECGLWVILLVRPCKDAGAAGCGAVLGRILTRHVECACRCRTAARRGCEAASTCEKITSYWLRVTVTILDSHLALRAYLINVHYIHCFMPLPCYGASNRS